MKQKDLLIKNKAIQICIESKESLTPNRIAILEQLIESKIPISAYDLKINLKEKNKSINISTIYRVIDFWIKLKIIHKISLLNKFVLCSNPEEIHTHITNVCTKCSNVIETCNKSMGLNLDKSSQDMGMLLTPDINLEIPVLCVNCK